MEVPPNHPQRSDFFVHSRINFVFQMDLEEDIPATPLRVTHLNAILPDYQPPTKISAIRQFSDSLCT